MTEDDDLIERLKQLPGNRPVEKKEEARDHKDLGTKKAKSLLNYPEVQQAFVDLARSQACVRVLEERDKEPRGT